MIGVKCLPLLRPGRATHEVVGWDGLREALQTVTAQTLASTGLAKQQIAGAGFGVAGYDWPSQRRPTREAIASLGLDAPFAFVNDTVIGLIAGSRAGWGIGVVAGTSCKLLGAARRMVVRDR